MTAWLKLDPIGQGLTQEDCISPGKEAGGSDQEGSSERGENMSSSGNILQAELTGFADRLDGRCKREESQGGPTSNLSKWRDGVAMN